MGDGGTKKIHIGQRKKNWPEKIPRESDIQILLSALLAEIALHFTMAIKSTNIWTS